MTVVVLDANVLASGVVGARRLTSTPGEILRRWRQGVFDLILSEHILTEVELALADPYFRTRLSPEEVARFLTLLREVGRIVPIIAVVEGVATHPEDDLVLATAVSARATLLVTGDKKRQNLRQFQGVTLLTPRAFLARLEGEQQVPE